MPDDKFVCLLLESGIKESELDHAFAGKSCSRFNKMLALYWKVPSVASKLRKLFAGKEINDSKYKQIRPLFLQLRD